MSPPVAGAALRAGGLLVATPAVVFALVTGLLPGDAARSRARGAAGAAELAELRAQLGLDRPWWERLVTWYTEAAGGDLGISLLTGRRVTTLLAERIPNATALLVGSLVVIGVGGGLLAGWVGKARSAMPAMATTVLAAIPVPVVAVVGTASLAAGLGWLSPVSLLPAGDSLWSNPDMLVLPVLTLAIPTAGWVGMTLGGVVADIRRMPHVVDARIRGVGSWRMLIGEVGPFLLAPSIRMFGLAVGGLLLSATVVESLFAVNGFGELMVSAIGGRDTPVVLATAVIAAVPVIVGFSVADLLEAGRRPRGRS